ncbi:methyltransferase domain-containing protein [Geopyxis carbonaria]|nr:methyltransferase domain-containing protein [Geopyxis carbonaria]
MPPPSQPLPYSPAFASADAYITSLLSFTATPLFRTLCGGVHILDFFTRDAPPDSPGPADLYSAIVPAEWRPFFDAHEIDDILDALMRTPLDALPADTPESLVEFIKQTRVHDLKREFTPVEDTVPTPDGLEWALNAGMRPKKVHEVANFAALVDSLARDVPGLSHILDYGSGQAYLSRTLAKKYGHAVIGLEARPNNIAAAQVLDARYDQLASKKARHRTKAASAAASAARTAKPPLVPSTNPTYIETRVSSGTLTPLLRPEHTSLLLVSLHSCGTLLHHALTAFAATPAARAVALIGCCHNLLTEKGGATFKTPALRSSHPRLTSTGTAQDPHGFPLSARLESEGVTLNVTARSMACQAPHNWTRASSAAFFRRHFFRALLQRVFLDHGLLPAPSPSADGPTPPPSDAPEPIIIGSLRAPSYESFAAYVSAALDKLGWTDRLALTPAQAAGYEAAFEERRKHVSVVWALMAVAAAVAESVIVVDRWLFLKEMGCREAWVRAAFEYGESPRNLVVVGIR